MRSAPSITSIIALHVPEVRQCPGPFIGAECKNLSGRSHDANEISIAACSRFHAEDISLFQIFPRRKVVKLNRRSVYIPPFFNIFNCHDFILVAVCLLSER